MIDRGWTPVPMRLAPLGLIVVAEAAWIAIAGGLVEEYALGTPVLGIPGLAVFVIVGVLTARVFGRRLQPAAWAGTAIGFVTVGAVVGVLTSAEARDALANGAGVVAALGRHPGGVVAGLAILRGFRHASQPLDEDALRHLFAGGVAFAVCAALAGSLIAEPWRDRFLDDTLGRVVVFAVTSILGLALTRQAEAERDSSEHWTPNTSWLGLIVVVVTIAGLLVVPAATASSPLVELAAYLLLAALVVVGALLGWTRQTVVGLVAVVVIFVGLGILLSLVPPGAPDGGAVGPG